MTRKLLIAFLFSTGVAFPLPFGIGDIVWDPQTMAQVEQDIVELQKLWTLEQQTQMMIKGAIAAGEYGNWRMAMTTAMMAASFDVNAATIGNDNDRLDRLNKALKTATSAAQESMIFMDHPSTQNAALLAMLMMQQAKAKSESQDILDRMNYQSQVKTYQSGDPGLTNTVEDMYSWHLQQ